MRQRPVHWIVGAVACVGLLVGCDSSKVSIESPALTGPDAAACDALIEALPSSVGDQLRRPVDPEDAYGAAYGEPAIVLRCGVSKPAGLVAESTCSTINGVDWFVPQDQVEQESADIVATTIGRTPYVEMRIPSRYRPTDAEFVDVAAAIKQHTKRLTRCY